VFGVANGKRMTKEAGVRKGGNGNGDGSND